MPTAAANSITKAAHKPRTARDNAPSTRETASEPRHMPDPAEARELALLHAHLAGDPGALEDLLTAYQDRLFAVCFRMVGDAELARDLTQDAMVKIIQGIDRFSGRSKLSTWMIRVTMNVCLTELRRLKLRRHASLDRPLRDRNADEGPSHASSLPEHEPGPPSSVEQRELTERLSTAMRLIGNDQRALLILRDLQSLDYRQIAELLDVPVGTVKSRLFRARVALREQMEALEPSAGQGEAGPPD